MKKKRIWVYASGIVFVVFCGWLHADTIRFKDGTEIQGRIVAEMDDFVMIQLQDGAKKISKDSILKITKCAMPKVKHKQPKKKRFQINDMKNVSLSKIASDLDSWFEKLGPIHKKSGEALRAASVVATFGNRKGMFSWLLEWCDDGFSGMGINDTQETLTTLRCVQRHLKDAIMHARESKDCPACHGSKRSKCRKCRGSGKIVSGKSVSYGLNKSGVKSKITTKTRKCPDCRGTGRMPCTAVLHVSKRYIKEMGGVEKAMGLLSLVSRHRLRLPGILCGQFQTKSVQQLKEIAENLHREGYYYMALEILKKIERRKKK